MTKPLPEPADDRDRKMLADIARVGWSVMAVSGSAEKPEFAFSIGLYRTHGHPEVIVIGLPVRASYPLINKFGASVRDGKRYEAGKRYDDLLEGYSAAIERVDRRFYPDYLGTAGWFHRDWDFPAVQLVWPDRFGVFPWEVKADPRHRIAEPVLSGLDPLHS